MPSIRALLSERRQARGVSAAISFPLTPQSLASQDPGRLVKKGVVVAAKPLATPRRARTEHQDQPHPCAMVRPDVDKVMGQIFGDDLADYRHSKIAEANPDLADEMEFRREHD